jgi:hypothetical protein
MLNAFAAGDQMISRAAIQEVAETFDILPRAPKVEERESAARIFPAASRAELWSMGNGNGNSHRSEPESEEFVRISPAYDEDIIFNESMSEPPASAGGYKFDNLTTKRNPPAYAGGSDWFGDKNNGQSL